MEEQNNKVFISGKIVENPVFSHELYGESFYEMKISCKRLSNAVDILPITISERLMKEYDFRTNAILTAQGQLRTYNKHKDGKSRLVLTIFITDMLNITNDCINNVVLTGRICKPPIYRTTPFNREIADLLIAVNRSYNKSDYIPCVVWGRNARYVKDMSVGDKITVQGRLQSREYQKKLSDTDIKTMTAYELSVSTICTEDNE